MFDQNIFKYSIFKMTGEIKNQNLKIVNLMETLQEYIRTYADLQSSMVDGFMEIAQANRYSPGMVCSDLITSPNTETRKFFMPDEEVGKQLRSIQQRIQK